MKTQTEPDIPYSKRAITPHSGNNRFYNLQGPQYSRHKRSSTLKDYQQPNINNSISGPDVGNKANNQNWQSSYDPINQVSTQQTQNRSMIASIQRGIKLNDVSQILGQSIANKSFLPSLPKTQKSTMSINSSTQFFQSERDEMYRDLQKIRKELDKCILDVNAKEKDIQRLRRVNEELIEEENKAENQDNKIQMEKDMKEECKVQEDDLKQLLWKKEKYIHQKDRLYKDSIVYQNKTQFLETEIEKITKDIQNINQEIRSIQQTQYNSRFVIEEMKNNFSMEELERQNQINDIIISIQQNGERDMKKQLRLKQQQEVAEVVKFGKTPQEKKFRCFLLTSQVFKKILNKKMKQEMEKYKATENIFLKIKGLTGIQQVHEVVTKFLDRDIVYQSLQTEISNHKESIQNREQQIQQLKQQRKELLKDQEYLLQMEQKANQDSQKQKNELIKKLDLINQQHQIAEVNEKTFYQWIIRSLTKLDSIKGIDLSKLISKEEFERLQKKYKNNSGEQQEQEEEQEEEEEDQQNNQKTYLKRMMHYSNKGLQYNFYDIFPREELKYAFQMLVQIVQKDLVVLEKNNEEKDIDATLFNLDQSHINIHTNQGEFQARNQRIDMELMMRKKLASQQSIQTSQKGISRQSSAKSREAAKTDLQKLADFKLQISNRDPTYLDDSLPSSSVQDNFNQINSSNSRNRLRNYKVSEQEEQAYINNERNQIQQQIFLQQMKHLEDQKTQDVKKMAQINQQKEQLLRSSQTNMRQSQVID